MEKQQQKNKVILLLLFIAVCPKLTTLASNIMQLKIVGKKTRETNRKGIEKKQIPGHDRGAELALGNKKYWHAEMQPV